MELKRKGEKGRRDLSGDEPRGVSEEAALLPAGGLALEHRLPSEEGRDQQWPLNGGSGAETAAASSSFPCLVFFHPSLSRLGIISALFAAIISCPAPLTSACPPIPFPLPRRTAFSQMVNLNGLLVKSASTDGFHLQTGLPDPPLQFLPPPFPPLLSSPTAPFFPAVSRERAANRSGDYCVMFRRLDAAAPLIRTQRWFPTNSSLLVWLRILRRLRRLNESESLIGDEIIGQMSSRENFCRVAVNLSDWLHFYLLHLMLSHNSSIELGAKTPSYRCYRIM